MSTLQHDAHGHFFSYGSTGLSRASKAPVVNPEEEEVHSILADNAPGNHDLNNDEPVTQHTAHNSNDDIYHMAVPANLKLPKSFLSPSNPLQHSFLLPSTAPHSAASSSAPPLPIFTVPIIQCHYAPPFGPLPASSIMTPPFVPAAAHHQHSFKPQFCSPLPPASTPKSGKWIKHSCWALCQWFSNLLHHQHQCQSITNCQLPLLPHHQIERKVMPRLLPLSVARTTQS